jgi:hypothetical protein
MIDIERSPEEEVEFRKLFEKKALPDILKIVDKCIKIGNLWD